MRLLFILTSFFVITGCTHIQSTLYGIKTIHKVDTAVCEAFISSLAWKNIAHTSFYADTSSYKCVYKLPVSEKVRKDFYQPVQILYFENDSLVSFHANCYAKGSLKNLDWNYDNRFDRFVPKSAISLDSAKFSFDDLVNCLSRKPGAAVKRYIVIIYWTSMLEKISKGAIEAVINNVDKFKMNNDVMVYLINNDASFIYD